MCMNERIRFAKLSLTKTNSDQENESLGHRCMAKVKPSFLCNVRYLSFSHGISSLCKPGDGEHVAVSCAKKEQQDIMQGIERVKMARGDGLKECLKDNASKTFCLIPGPAE